MKRNDLYTIAFKKYKQGKHQIAFDIKDELLDKFPFSDIRSLNVRADIEMFAGSNFLQLDIALEGRANVQCGRCLDYYDQPIKYQTQLTVEMGDVSGDLSEADTQIVLSRKEDELVLDKHFYDYIVVAMPYNPSHPEENGEYTCNPEMLEQIKKYAGRAENKQTDPRWDQLKNIFNN